MSKNLQSGTNAPNLEESIWIYKTMSSKNEFDFLLAAKDIKVTDSDATPNSTCHATYRIYTIQIDVS